jgi:dihydroflavonol-4-reductase
VKVLVTGASGVVGRVVTRHLREAGHQVRALVRSETAAEVVEPSGATPYFGDVVDPESLVSPSEGCDWVFDVCGLNAYCQPDPTALMEVNVVGSLNVLRAAEAAGVRRLVHTSSSVAIGEASGTMGREDSPHRGFYLTDYERSKLEGELAVLSEPGDVEVVVVNPSSVQGPGRITGTGKPILDLARNRLPMMANTRISMVDIDDCARGHLLAAEKGVPGERYLLNGCTLSSRELIDMFSQFTGRKIRTVVAPDWVLQAGGVAALALFRSIGKIPPICPDTVKNLLHGARYDGSRATRDLGLEYLNAEGLINRLVAWYRSEGLLEV